LLFIVRVQPIDQVLGGHEEVERRVGILIGEQCPMIVNQLCQQIRR
jgi:hypothetical protein